MPRTFSTPTRVFLLLVWLGVGFGTFARGLGNLGYYGSLYTSCLVSLFGIITGVLIALGAQGERKTPLHVVRKILATGATATGGAVLILLANGLRTPTCDVLLGLQFFAMGPLLSGILALSLGAAWAWITQSIKKAAILGYGTLILCLVYEGWVLYTEPSVFSYTAFFGYIAGPIYDADIQLTRPYFLSRLSHLCLWVLAYTSLHFAHAANTGHPLLGLRKAPRKWQLLSGACTTLLLVLAWQSGPLGMTGPRSHIETVLSGTVASEQVILHFDESNALAKKGAPALLQDALYRMDQLHDLFGKRPDEPVHIYSYASSQQKRALMGAQRVRIAKPWLNEIHLSKAGYGNPVMLHELAHVVGADFAPGPLHVPTLAFVLPQMALIEGLATGIEQRRGDRSLHQWVAAITELEKRPSMAQILGPGGYVNAHGPTAYATAGSFLSFLWEEYGRDKVLDVYHDGDFERAFGEPLTALEKKWDAMLKDRERVPVPNALLEEARFRYDRKPILDTDCPVVVARLLKEGNQWVAKRQPAKALERFEEVCAYRPHAENFKLFQVKAYGVMGDLAAAEALAEEVAVSDASSLSLASRARHWQADLLWRSGKREKALQAYLELERNPVSLTSKRTLRVKALGVAHPKATIREAIRDYLVDTSLTSKERRGILETTRSTESNSPLIAYLLGKAEYNKGKWEEAIPLMKEALSLEDEPEIQAEAYRILGLSEHRTANHQKASDYFQKSHALLPADRLGLRLELEDWINRCRWALDKEKRSP